MATMWALRTTFPPSYLCNFIEHLPLRNTKPSKNVRFLLLENNRTFYTASCIKPQATQALQSLNSNQKDKISLYVDALLQWNQKMNLTAVTERSDVMERHIVDSLAILPPIEDFYAARGGGSPENLRLIDVGTGAGLPGFVLAIARPDWKVTLLESMNKRCTFLEHAVSITGLSNVQVLRGRAETYGRNPDFRETYDVVVARAVAELRILAEYCLPLVRVGGLFIAAKGHDVQEELDNAERAIGLLGASVLKKCTVESYSPYGQRTAIVCLKAHPTPKKYPRDPGTPAKQPL